MTLSEFKLWFEGYCEHIPEAPTAEQFARIKAKLAETEPARQHTVSNWGNNAANIALLNSGQLTPRTAS